MLRILGSEFEGSGKTAFGVDPMSFVQAALSSLMMELCREFWWLRDDASEKRFVGEYHLHAQRN